MPGGLRCFSRFSIWRNFGSGLGVVRLSPASRFALGADFCLGFSLTLCTLPPQQIKS